MKKLINKTTALMSSAMIIGMTSQSAHAQVTTTATASNADAIFKNITQSLDDIPSLLTALSYIAGLVLGVLGIMKIKDHVEQPQQTPLKDGAIRLMAGGALFALPIIFEAMQGIIDDDGAGKGASVTQNALKGGGLWK